MTEPELIEKMAEAIYRKRNGHGCVPWSRLHRDHKTPYIGDARAALAAIRESGREVAPAEPDDAMIRAGVNYRLSTRIGGDNRWPEDTAALYRAMLAASPLKGTEP